jgi:hypothetical protein
MRLVVEDTPEGVMLRPVSPFQPTQPEEVFGSLPHNGPPKTLDKIGPGSKPRRGAGMVAVER